MAASRMPQDGAGRPIPVLVGAPTGGVHSSGAMTATGTWINTTAFSDDTQVIAVHVIGGAVRYRLSNEDDYTALATDHYLPVGSWDLSVEVNAQQYSYIGIYCVADGSVEISELR